MYFVTCTIVCGIAHTHCHTHTQALAKPNGYETVCVLLNTLRYISNGSPALSHGFIKFISFGLLDKISTKNTIIKSYNYFLSLSLSQYVSSWCSSLCFSAMKLKSQPGWSKATDEVLFTITVSSLNLFAVYPLP